ncbi:hypothetical protein [Alienimonas californiensis]|uniref:Uncharacterized protein n=1 Tax=Alienimonas californiensis TaxID=2527989 RepID=A0A517P6E8_9PLAN|nr:hypothetical protein [Alienimonas californiensis]QDT14958.1 hypothetical protein CA12_10380 [Alienimonas californiensis]
MPDLPPNLAYLARPLAAFEAALRGGAEAEDLDSLPLEQALKGRLGLEADPAAAVAADLAALEAWLGSFPSDEQAGWCVVGVFHGLLSFGFDVASLGEAPDPGPQPTIVIELPPGWTAEDAPCMRTLTKGRRGAVHATFIASQPGFGGLLRAQWRAGGFAAAPVAFGRVCGEKLVSERPGPVPHKRVQYELDAPGGSVMATVFRTTGRSFDEAELEAVLHTLRVRPPMGRNAAAAVS